MKSLFIILSLSMTATTFAADEWKVVAESTTACKDTVQVLAKEGEKFVYVKENDSQIKLVSEDGSAFSEQSGKEITYTNAKSKTLSPTEKKFTFIQPSVVNGNPPKLLIDTNGVSERCRMDLK